MGRHLPMLFRTPAGYNLLVLLPLLITSPAPRARAAEAFLT